MDFYFIKKQNIEYSKYNKMSKYNKRKIQSVYFLNVIFLLFLFFLLEVLDCTSVFQILAYKQVLAWLPNNQTDKNSNGVGLQQELHICIFKHDWGLMFSDTRTSECFYHRKYTFPKSKDLQMATTHKSSLVLTLPVLLFITCLCYLYPCMALLVPGAWRLLCFHTYPRFLNIPQSRSLAFLLKFQVDITHSLNTGPTKQRELEKKKDTTIKQSSSSGSMFQSQGVGGEAVR